MSAETRVCANCRAKFAAERTRCPRCRTVVREVAASARQASSRRIARATAVLTGLFALGLGLVWATREEAAASVPVLSTLGIADPLAARRPAPAGPTPASPSAAAQPQVPRPAASTAAPATAESSWPDVNERDADVARFKQQLLREPANASLHGSLGMRLFELERFKEAVPPLERAAELAPADAVHWINQGRVFAHLRQWRRAIEAYREAQRRVPDDAGVAFNLALAQQNSGDGAGAVENLQRAIALNPGEPSYRLALATSYEDLQKKSEAAAAYADYLKLSPADPDAERLRARIAQLTAADSRD